MLAKLNNIDPAPGKVLNIYMSTKALGSGVRRFVVIGISPRYVSLYHIPLLHCFKVKRNEWHKLSLTQVSVSHAALLEELTLTCQRYVYAGKRYNRTSAANAIKVLL